MSEIDKLSEKIGAIGADIKHLIAKTNAIDTKVESAQNKAIELSAAVKSAHKRVDKLAPTVERHEGLKNKAIGVISVLAFVFSLVGSVIGKLLHF